jgi:hypothetical protein
VKRRSCGIFWKYCLSIRMKVLSKTTTSVRRYSLFPCRYEPDTCWMGVIGTPTSERCFRYSCTVSREKNNGCAKHNTCLSYCRSATTFFGGFTFEKRVNWFVKLQTSKHFSNSLQRISWEANSHLFSQQNTCLSRNDKVLSLVQNKQPANPVLCQVDPFDRPHHIYLKSALILSSHLRLYIMWSPRLLF